MTKLEKLKTIFLAGPIGSIGSDTRDAADTLKSEIVLPALEEAFGPGGFTLERADEIGEPGRISLQVLEKLVASDIVIVDLSDLNPNVMYELGVRQACLKPYILLRPGSQVLPFDIADIRAISYEFSLRTGKEAIRQLREMLANVDKSVTATDELLFRPTSASTATGLDGYQQRIQIQILDQLNAIRDDVNAITFGVSHLINHEERQRADLADYRQQELGMRLMESMAGTNPDALVALMRQFSNTGSTTEPESPIEETPAGLNRQQRRAASKQNRKQ